MCLYIYVGVSNLFNIVLVFCIVGYFFLYLNLSFCFSYFLYAPSIDSSKRDTENDKKKPNQQTTRILKSQQIKKKSFKKRTLKRARVGYIIALGLF